jgi:hypothetical protein
MTRQKASLQQILDLDDLRSTTSWLWSKNSAVELFGDVLVEVRAAGLGERENDLHGAPVSGFLDAA